MPRRERDADKPNDESVKTFFKGFLSGIVLANFNRQLVFGALLGIAGGMFYEQEFGAPDVKEKYEELRDKFQELLDKSKGNK